MNSAEPDDEYEENINLLDYWRVLRKRRTLVLGLVLVSSLTAAFHSYFIAERIYESKASILPPRESGGAGIGLAALFTASPAGQLLGGLMPGGGTNRESFLAILKSRTIGGELVDRFGLQEYYRMQTREQAISRLLARTQVTVSKEGVMLIGVEDKDPKLAANIANAYVTHLDRIWTMMGTTRASSQRTFIADRLEKTEKALRESEDALKRFQEKNQAVVLPEQTRSAIDEAAKIRAEITSAQVQLEAMRSYQTDTTPDVVQQRRRIEELKRSLSETHYGNGTPLPPETSDRRASRQDVHVAFTRIPELQAELVRLTRDQKIQEAVFTLLTQQYEQAKIQEAKDMPTVQHLDRAVPAEVRSKPKTALNIGIAAAISLCVGLFLAFFLEYIDRLGSHKKALAA